MGVETPVREEREEYALSPQKEQLAWTRTRSLFRIAFSE